MTIGRGSSVIKACMREIPDNSGLLGKGRGYKVHFYLKNEGCFFDKNTKKQG
jgi:hypothetical protein